MPFVTFDFLPTEHTTEVILEFSEDAVEFSGSMAELGNDTTNFLLNCGSLILFLLILIFRYVLFFCLKGINKANRQQYAPLVKYAEELADGLFWGNFILFILEAYIEFGLSAYMAVVKPVEADTFGEDTMSGEVLSYYLSWLFFPLLVLIIPGLAIWIIFVPAEKCRDPDF